MRSYSFVKWMEGTESQYFVQEMRQLAKQNQNRKQAVYKQHPTKKSAWVYLANSESWPQKAQPGQEYWYVTFGGGYPTSMIHIENGEGPTFEEADADYAQKLQAFSQDQKQVIQNAKWCMEQGHGLQGAKPEQVLKWMATVLNVEQPQQFIQQYLPLLQQSADQAGQAGPQAPQPAPQAQLPPNQMGMTATPGAGQMQPPAFTTSM